MSSCDGRTKIMIRGTVSEYIPNPTFEVVARPGAQEEYFRNGNPEGKTYREVIGEPMRSIPAFQRPEPRIEVMNELGVDRSLMFPTLASLLEERMRDDPELTHAAIHSLNEWMYEEWRFNYEDRIFATPVITLPDRREGDRRTRVGCGARGQDRPHSPCARARLPRLALVRLSRVRPVLAGRRGCRHSRVDAFLGQRIHAVHERLDRTE